MPTQRITFDLSKQYVNLEATFKEIFVLKIAVFCLVLVSLSACVALVPITDSKPLYLSANQLQQVKAKVTQDFFDPESATFRNLRAVSVVLEDGTSERRVCGEVNGKNRYGAYVGYSAFGGTVVDGIFQQKDFFSACEVW